jgi:hypothetical protein
MRSLTGDWHIRAATVMGRIASRSAWSRRTTRRLLLQRLPPRSARQNGGDLRFSWKGNFSRRKQMLPNKWTREQQAELDDMEARLIAGGTPANKAASMAEREMLKRIERQQIQKEMAS